VTNPTPSASALEAAQKIVEMIPHAYIDADDIKHVAAALDAFARAAVERAASRFDRMADECEVEAVKYDHYEDRLGRWHPARASARQCRDKAQAHREHAALVRSAFPAQDVPHDDEPAADIVDEMNDDVQRFMDRDNEH
jgi:hypothetical protein